MSLTIIIGWTLNSRTNREYSSFDGYAPGVPQHEEAFTIDGFDDKDPSEVAEAVFDASNRLGSFGPDTRSQDDLVNLIMDAINETGWRGTVDGLCPKMFEDDPWHDWELVDPYSGSQALCRLCGKERSDLVGHFSLSTGDTVTVLASPPQAWGGRMMLACQSVGWRRVFPEEEACANCGRAIFQSGADNRWYHRVEGTAMCPNRGEPGNSGQFPLFAVPKEA